MSSETDARQIRLGYLYTTAAFTFWGLVPVYWKLLGEVPSPQQLAHRVVWSAVFMVGVLLWQGRFAGLGAVLGRRRTLVTLLASTALIGANWFFFLYSIASDQLLQASLGYFITPLVNVLLGLVFLRETLRPVQWSAIVLASVGVGLLTWRVGELPWLALILAFSFGFYGLLRKTVPAGPSEGLALETWLLAPLALLYLGQRHLAGEGAFVVEGPWITFLLLLTGVFTATPLLWFTHGARRLPLATVGMLQYLAPTGQFLLAVLVYHEPFGRVQLVAFAIIWTALALYTWDARRGRRRAAAVKL